MKVQAFLAKKSIKLVLQPFYFPDLNAANLVLSHWLKEQLEGLKLSLNECKEKWEGVIRTQAKVCVDSE
jgi:hypothetical protein